MVNGGAESGTAAESAATLTDASFSLLDPADAVAVRDSTVVLHGESRRLAGRTVAEVLGVEESAVALGTPDDPNWAAFGGDVDVLVVLGPALP